ncbi:hypothetical protein GDO81_018467 [Engystomops pustulosus]|uniref:Uncharacterized protein n=1 Tax=Engystomops pustulosus TaxID=76066 RepID=A0AAV6ZP47_ENGPU|nr:hypothetical protein GDO81_018467 [Engystomops pustulosus]
MKLGQELPALRQVHQHYPSCQEFPILVDHSHTLREWCTMASLATIHSTDGCKTEGLGCKCGRFLFSGNLASYPEDVLELSRIESGSRSSEGSYSSINRSSCESPVRQFHDSGLPSTSGRNKISRPHGPLKRNILLGTDKCNISVCSTPKG